MERGTYRAKVDSSDIMNLSFAKDIANTKWSLNVTNLTNEIYERPDTYNQDDRRISLSFMSKY